MARNVNKIKADFDASLQRLGKINDAIAANIENKKQFSRQIIDRLSRINQQIQELANKIKGLKSELDNLRGTVTTNDTTIRDKDREIQDLKTNLNDLSHQLVASKDELKMVKDNYQREKQQLQQAVAHTEAQLQNATQQVNALTVERDALKQELANRGDPGAHAKAIEDLNNQHTQQLQQQQEQHRNALNDLMEKKNQELAAATAESHRLAEELRQKTEELQQVQRDNATQIQQLQDRITALTTEKENLTNQITALQQQVQALTAENDELIQRIIAATQAISVASDSLRQISDNDPTQFNQDDLDRSFAEIEASIQAISNSLSGNAPLNNNVRGPRVARGMDPATVITVKDNRNADLKFTLQQILDELRAKAGRVAGVDKYETALTAVRAATTPQEVVDILVRNNISFKNGAMMGGRRRINKTRKNKKTRKIQKGGFTYKLNSKRRSLTQSMSKDVARGRKSKKH
jgi:predicted  nucleic acid-binding Zn-ribbon protein